MPGVAPMTSHRVAALLVLVVLAGCLGGVDTSNDTTPEPPAAEWANGTTIDSTALAHQHFRALRTAGSFTRNRTASVAIDGDVRPDEPHPEWYRPPSYTHEQVDLNDRRYHRVSATVGGSQRETFVSADEDADRRRPCPTDACEWEYRYLARNDPDALIGEIDRFNRDRPVEMLTEVTADWDFSYAGTTTLDGELVYRYTATRTFDGAVHPFAERPETTGTLLVTADGVIRRWETSYTGPASVTVDGETREVTVTQRQVIRFSAVGTTTVERPAWVDRARGNDPAPETATAGS